ncbi:hypothetical protein CWB73_18565 [Pseudoalteromonas phenolica]|uniref:TonB-dependent receptor plug domain-containing protein n=1 Tax=Pseudoalteromonas phenolica TaxID=161398 RepID=A0A5S3YQ01_9GAMM|nr:TonB-dependent receptor plug domain-containing protein [Pseudoalteromonas phenolica]TMP77819.1 hypothetical protein CWB73_18565 [Pseudoalteromonas phenolica]
MTFIKSTLAVLVGTFATNALANTPNNNDDDKANIESITVVASKPDGIKISSGKLLSLPGTGNDPLKGLEALPGVVLATPSTGGPVAQPAIRGSSVSDNLYLTDGLEMGYVFHNDGLSVYNPLLIESFELKTGAWSSQYANANGGVILTELRDPDADNPTNVLDLSFFRSGFLYEQAIANNAAFYVSFRESLVHTYVDNFIEDEDFSFAVPPRNRDYQAKLIWDLDDNNVIRATASGAKDYIEIAFDADGRDIGKNPDLASGERYQTYFNSQAISWQNFNGDFETTTSLNLLTQNQQEREGDVFRWDADITKVILKADSQYQGEDVDVLFGAKVQSTEVDYLSSGRLLPCNLEFEVCPPSYFSDMFAEEGTLKFEQYHAYVSANGDLSANWDYQVGVALLGTNNNSQTYLEPRARLGYRLNDAHKLNLSAGIHHTLIDDYQYLIDGYGNTELEASEATHIVLNLESTLDDGLSMKTELFYKALDNLVVANPNAQKRSLAQDVSGFTRFEDVASGTAYGIELLVNKQLSDDWFGWASIAYSKTERDNPLTQQKFNSEFDLPWVANIVLDYKWDENWQIGAKWRFQSGRRYTQVNSATPYVEPNSATNEPLFYVPSYGEFNAEQWGNYHRLDIRADYKTEWFGLDTNLYIEVLNLYGSRAVQELEYNAAYTEFEKDYQFPDMPLPSIGISMTF